MCSPTLAFMAISTVASAYMQQQQGKANASSVTATAANNAKISEFNAQQQDTAATDAVRRGAQDSAVIKQNARRATATGRAQLAGSGLLADTGTALDLQSQNAEAGEFNALTAMNNANREAYGHTLDAQSERFGGQVGIANANYQAKVIKKNALYDAAGTLVTGFGSTATKGGLFKSAPMQGPGINGVPIG